MFIENLRIFCDFGSKLLRVFLQYWGGGWRGKDCWRSNGSPNLQLTLNYFENYFI